MSDRATVDTFGDRFIQRSEHYGRLCVGIDPHKALLERWGLAPDIGGLQTFTEICVEAFSDSACMVKPQIAFYESFGSAGFQILEWAMGQLRSAGVLVLADAKRGDIGTTMAGYAQAWLTPGAPLEADALTVSPYLGYGSLTPAFDMAEQHYKGVIVLAATSNPEGQSVQGAVQKSGQSVYQSIIDDVRQSNAVHTTVGHVGNIGVVIGATLDIPLDLHDLNGLILMPGVGSQGGTAEDIRRITGDQWRLSSPNVSRAILSAGPSVNALKSAVEQTSQNFQVS